MVFEVEWELLDDIDLENLLPVVGKGIIYRRSCTLVRNSSLRTRSEELHLMERIRL